MLAVESMDIKFLSSGGVLLLDFGDGSEGRPKSNPLLKEVYDIRHHRRLRIVSPRSHVKAVEVRVALVSF